MRGSRFIKRTFKGLVILFVLLVLLMGALFALMHTSAARKAIAAYLSERLTYEAGATVTVSPLDVFGLERAHTPSVTLSDTRGECARADDIGLSWSIAELLRGCIHIYTVRAGSIRLAQRPELHRPERRTPSHPLQWLRRLRIDHVDLAQLSLTPPLVATETQLTVNGELLQPSAGGAVTSSLHVAPVDGESMKGYVTAVLRDEMTSLDISASYTEPEGGLLSRTAGIHHHGMLSFELDGAGPQSKWQGTLSATAGDIAHVDASITAALGETASVSAKGSYHISQETLPKGLQPVLGAQGQFVINASGDIAHTMSLEASEFTGGLGTLRISGGVDIAQRALALDLAMDSVNPAAFEELTRIASSGALAARATLTGSFRTPVLTGDVTSSALRSKETHLDTATGHFTLAPLGPIAKPFPGLRLIAQGTAAGFADDRTPNLAPSDVTWKLDADAPHMNDVHVTDLTLAANYARASIRGAVDLRGLSGNVLVDVAFPQLSYFAPQSGADGFGRMQLQITGDIRARTAAGALNGTVSDVTGVPEQLHDIVGSKLRFETPFAITGGKAELSSIRIGAGEAELQGRASYAFADKQVGVSYHGQANIGAILSKAFKRSTKAAVDVSGAIDGVWPELRVKATAVCPDFVTGKESVGRIEAAIEAVEVPSKPRGRIKANATRNADRATFDGAFAKSDSLLKLTGIKLTAPSCESSGALAIDLKSKTLRGSFTADAKDIAGLGRLLGQEAGGKAHVEAVLTPKGARQDAKLTVSGQRLTTSLGSAKQIDVSASLEDLFNKPRGAIKAKLDSCQTKSIHWNHLAASADGDIRNAAVAIDASGTSTKPFTLNASGRVGRDGNKAVVTVSTLNGAWNAAPMALTTPATITWSPAHVDVSPCMARIGTGSARIQGRYTSEAVDFQATFDKLPLDAFLTENTPVKFGAVSGQAELRGSPGAFAGTAELHAPSLRAASVTMRDLPPTACDVKVTLADGALKGALSANGGLLSQPMTAELHLPIEISISPMAVAIPRDGALHGRLTVDALLDPIAQVMLPDDQRLSGALSARLDVGGTVASPRLSGQATVQKGTYDLYSTGLTLRDIHAVISGAGNRLQLTEASASDGHKGTITVAGWLDANPEKKFPLNITFDFNSASLVRRDDLTASINGQLKLTGNATQPTLAGALHVESAEFQPISRGYEPMGKIEVILPDHAAGPAPAKPTQRAATVIPLALDIHVDTDRLFVRRAGLESQWKANLAVSGHLPAPSVTGRIALMKGRLDLLGKRFTLTRGDVVLNGAWPPVPSLDIASEVAAKDTTAYFNVTGTTETPKITLESNPPLPQNEILSRLLFGRSIDRISPFQALQLAQAAESFSGSGGIFQTTDRLRQTLGLADLNVQQGDEKGSKTSVSAGKYLGEKVYVGVERGSGADTGKVHAEIELAPNLSLETTAGANAKSNIGLKWKRDY